MSGSIEKFFFKPKPIEEIVNTAKVVFDTNALLSAYQWKDVVFHEVLEALSKLSGANRLKIPPQVFKEFIHQRPLKITEAIEKIELLLTSIQKPQKLESVLPLLGLIDKENTYVESEKSYAVSRDKYKEDLKELIIDLKKLFNDDIVLDSLRPFFEEINFEMNSEEALMRLAEERAKAKRPPLTGGDGGKTENKYGDFFVWNYILSLKEDVIFVTTDFKEDWFYKSGAGKDKKPISPRRELIEEFYDVSQGKTICIASLQDFMRIFKPDLAQEVVDSLSESQIRPILQVHVLWCKALNNIEVDNMFEFIDKVDLGDVSIINKMMSGRKDPFDDRIETDEKFEIIIEIDKEIDPRYLLRRFNDRNPLFYVSSISYERSFSNGF
ncbi:PIN-like domain-containing protein [Paenibacillus amylolyticus]|uniref:PIN-like domain-containing protein n=1 Tax=Paenibacillus amylolyticus TaxID=1451 RepID=UPI000FDA31BA|nr:PIN-like domain-containing protein [Paenibacillus amylolyticus]